MAQEGFAGFFERTTGYPPYPYQDELGVMPGFPSLLAVPTGAGKTAAVIVAWLWKRLQEQASTPRRLVYCLPTRVLVEQTVDCAVRWVADAGMKIPVSVLMGGTVDDPVNRRWDVRPEEPVIIVGTQDQLISRALNRGYAMSRFRWPLEFGLLNNDCLWVFDEIQLMGSSLLSSTQLQAFRSSMGTWLPVHSLWMSATSDVSWLGTVDYRSTPEYGRLAAGDGVLRLTPADLSAGTLAKRYRAPKQLVSADIGVEAERRDPVARQKPAPHGKPSYASQLARHIVKRHKGGRTLVICNTVGRAVSVYRELSKLAPGTDVQLLHSRFRPAERGPLQRSSLAAVSPHVSPGSILVTTQVVEAGVDITCQLMYTELAPMASLVQRFGRFNRTGELASCDESHCIYWMDVPDAAAAPYEKDQLIAARAWLGSHADASPAALAGVPLDAPHGDVVRRRDLLGLFDTTPDLEGNDIDVSRYIRADQERSVYVFWRHVAEDTRGPLEQPEPDRSELCPAPLGDEMRDFLRTHAWYLLDPLTGGWNRQSDARRVYPGMEILLVSDQGGYDPVIGWDPSSAAEVAVMAPDAHQPDSMGSNASSVSSTWVSLGEHTCDVEAEEGAILALLGGAVPADVGQSVMRAARLHDWGKAYPAFQNLIAMDAAHSGTIWAKAPPEKWTGGRGPAMRHELASGLAALERGESFLVAYLSAAHHGKIRGSIRSLPGEHVEKGSARSIRGVVDGTLLPGVTLGGEVLSPQSLSLAPAGLGLDEEGTHSWTDQWCGLRDDPAMGPFRLAYLEALMKAADERASAAEQAALPHRGDHDD
jgi:CRISPR-associated endonuclease/helicase Cas3